MPFIIHKGVCSVCGCTMNDPCYHPEHGFCWWADDEQTICSHCADEAIANDPRTVHCVNTSGRKLFENL